MPIDPEEPLNLSLGYAVGSFVPGLILMLSHIANGASYTDPGGVLVTLNSPDGQFIMQGEVQCGMEAPFPVLVALGQQLWLIKGNEMLPVRA